MTDIKAFSKWPSNAELIEAVHDLGYIKLTDYTLDCTYGRGTFWKKWRPELLIMSDLAPTKEQTGVIRMDFTKMWWSDGKFQVVVFDPPYKLNGTDQGEGERYGVHERMTWQDRMEMISAGLKECARVTYTGGFVLLKCQDQVSSGAVRWQRFRYWEEARDLGLYLVDMLDMIGGRPQPEGRRQVHARRNSSTLMIFVKGEKQ